MMRLGCRSRNPFKQSTPVIFVLLLKLIIGNKEKRGFFRNIIVVSFLMVLLCLSHIVIKLKYNNVPLLMGYDGSSA